MVTIVQILTGLERNVQKCRSRRKTIQKNLIRMGGGGGRIINRTSHGKSLFGSFNKQPIHPFHRQLSGRRLSSCHFLSNFDLLGVTVRVKLILSSLPTESKPTQECIQRSASSPAVMFLKCRVAMTLSPVKTIDKNHQYIQWENKRTLLPFRNWAYSMVRFGGLIIRWLDYGSYNHLTRQTVCRWRLWTSRETSPCVLFTF